MKADFLEKEVFLESAAMTTAEKRTNLTEKSTFSENLKIRF